MTSTNDFAAGIDQAVVDMSEKMQHSSQFNSLAFDEMSSTKVLDQFFVISFFFGKENLLNATVFNETSIFQLNNLTTYLSMCIGGQFESDKASLPGVLRLFRALAFCRNEGQKGFFNTFGIRLLERFVNNTAAVAINAPPPTRAPQASPTDTLNEEFRFLRDEGGKSVL